MVRVNFVQADGSEHALDLSEGTSVMEGAVKGGIDGIDADCGGAVSCATCHVHVPAEWYARLAPPSHDESDMLGFAVEADETSRLSCQIVLSPELDGLVVQIPATQR